MTATATYLRRDPADVKPWSETCGQIRPLIEAADGAAAEVHHVEIDHAKLHYHARTDELPSASSALRASVSDSPGRSPEGASMRKPRAMRSTGLDQ